MQKSTVPDSLYAFTADDLQANKSGHMTHAQIEDLQLQLAICFVSMIVVAGLSLWIAITLPITIFFVHPLVLPDGGVNIVGTIAALLCLAAIALVVRLANYMLNLYRDMRAKQAHWIIGIVKTRTKKRISKTGTVIHYFISVGDMEFRIAYRVYERLPTDTLAVVYYTPYSRTFLSTQQLNTAVSELIS